MTRIVNLLIWASFFTALFLPLGAHAVKKENLYLFSAVKGRIVKNGQPVVGLKVERSTFWNMEEKPRLETTYTDEKGFYSFPEMTGSAEFGFLAKLFHVPRVLQTMYALNEQQRITIYLYGRGNYEKNAETGQPIIRLITDLNDKKLILEDDYEVESKILEPSEKFNELY